MKATCGFLDRITDIIHSLGKKQALRVLMPFATTYLCEAAFSAMAAVKTKHRQRLDAVEKDLRLKLSSIAPNFGELCAKMQAKPSH